jgi:putative FmdB family regulatory protein
MPTYEYECRECSGRVEAFQKMSDEPLTICADCGGPLRRLLFPVGIVFKGSGFYVNDYKKDNGNGGRGEKKSESSDSETKSTPEKSSTESKPASATTNTSTTSTTS